MVENNKVNESLLKDDLYQAVNGEWLKTAVIPADRPTAGGFSELDLNIEKTLMHDLGEMLEGKNVPDDKHLKEFLKYYKLASDFETRDAKGFEPAKKYLDAVLAIKDLNDWKDKWLDFALIDAANPFSFFVDPDMKNTQEYALYADVTPLFLPDKTYYEEGNEQGAALLSVLSDMLEKLFEKAGYDAEFAKKTISEAIEYDRLIAPFQKDSTERADYVKVYNPYSFEDFSKLSTTIDFGAVARKIVKTTPDKIVVTEPKFYEAADRIVNDDTFEQLRSWIFVHTLMDSTGFLSDDVRVLGGTFSRALSGAKEAMKPEKAAYHLATARYDQVVGLYYAHKYFGPDAKADVQHMVEKMVAVYKKRLETNDWLSKETAKKAVVKLDALGINVGYPDELDPLYEKYLVDETKNLLDNAIEFRRIQIADNFDRYGKPVDRTRWEMPAHQVNAYYNPSFNIIVFPAAILQAPFYSLKQTASENYGGIGAVIAHEISHAFDNNGSQFDEFGNLSNWWTDEDLKHFEGLAQEMIEEFDGLETEAGKCNGKLVVSENIADAGGLSCALEAAKGEEKPDIKGFFLNWARIWCMKSSLERQKLLLAIDVHAPNVLRANVQPKNLQDFYDVFDVHEGDGMWLEPEKRIHIW